VTGDWRLATHNPIYNFRHLPPGKPASGQVRHKAATLGLPGERDQLSSPLLGEGERHCRAIAALRPLSRQSPVDQSSFNAHREEVAGKSSRTPSPGRPGLHVTLCKGCIVEQPKLRSLVESRFHR
jgi:hypothetical protein